MTLAAQIAVDAIDNHGAIQHHAELEALLEYLLARLPSSPRILELGSDRGGTLRAWRGAWPSAHVVAVSLSAGPYATTQDGAPAPCHAHGAQVIDADTHEPATLERVRDAFGGEALDFLFIDGDHSLEGCAQDVADYGALLKVGGLLALHDITPHASHLEIGCPIVWADLLEQGSRWLFPATFTAGESSGWGGIGVVTSRGTR